jgi:hypothetical protein
MTIYAGDSDNKKLIVIPKKDYSPVYHDVQYRPRRASLNSDHTVLLVGCDGGNLLFYTLTNPYNPLIMRQLTLNSTILCLLPIMKDLLLCG